jgi:hypothetical protein
MSHAFSFCLISVFIYYVIKWYEENSWRTSLVLGAVYGLITLVRPTNAIVIVFFAFYGIESLDIFKQRIKFWYRNWAQILAFVSVIVVIWIPQFIYWHKITGSWLHNSYEKSGSEFFFSNPQVINQLFSFRKGLLLYSPLIGLAFLGVLSLYWYQRRLFLAVLLFTILNIYVLSSWWAWWFGGGFGPRLYTDSYAMMGIGLASFLTLIRKSHLALKLSVSLIIGFFLFLSLFQSYQFYKGKLHYVAMTKESYMASFLNLNPGKAYYNNLVDPNLKNAKKGVYYKDERTYQEVFEQNSEIEKIKQIEFYIRNTPDYLEAVRKKALKRNISIDSMIRIDALWVLEMEKSKNSRK